MTELTRRTSMFSRTPTSASDLTVDAASQARLADLKIDSVQPDPDNPRRHFDPDEMKALVDSIKANGLIQPIVVRPGEGGAHIIIAGERRWRAATQAGHVSIKAIIRPSLLDSASLLLAQIAENENRADLTTADLVAAIAKLVRLGVAKKEIASRLGMDPTFISRLVALSNLPPDLAPLLATMGVDPLYELLQQHKRTPDAVEKLLAAEPVPTRASIRSLGSAPAAPTSDQGLPFVDSSEAGATHGKVTTPDVTNLAPAQSPDPKAPPLAPAQVTPKPLSVDADRPVTIRVEHPELGKGRVVPSASLEPGALPISFSDRAGVRHIPMSELTILAIE